MRAQPASWQLWTVSLLLAIMPLCFAVSGRFKILPMTLLFVVGVVLLATRAESRQAWRLAWPVIAVCALRLLYDIGNFLSHRLDWSTLDLPAQTVLFLGIAAVFTLPVKQRVVAIGFSLTAVLLGAASLYQRYVLGVDRPYGLNGGDWAAVEFAMYLLVLVLLAMLQALRPGISRGERWLHVAAMVVGLYGAVLTQSRGPLLSFAPVYLGLMLWYAMRSRHWRRVLLLFAVTVLGMLAVTATLHREMVERLTDVPAQIASFGNGGSDGGATAVGERLEMWRTAWQAFCEHPLAGIGLDQFGVYVREQVAMGQASPLIAKYVHPHSEYLESMVAGGVPALLVLLLFLAVPLGFFARHLGHPQEPVAAAAAAGVMVIGMYVLCAFGDNVFYRAMPQSLYLFLVSGLAVSIGRLRCSVPSR
ncbi:O-antigen ligase family protein [Rhodanobacter thiooxydans]|nr:O-antigen ligase family protein [Rhodanobacter thiooxydans]MCW0201358.1 O-antigen ligase family protein [Rhodanobacter thiooxydans]